MYRRLAASTYGIEMTGPFRFCLLRCVRAVLGVERIVFELVHGGLILNPAPAGSLTSFSTQIPDPRGRQGRRNPLGAMLAFCPIRHAARRVQRSCDHAVHLRLKRWVVACLGFQPPTAQASGLSQVADGPSAGKCAHAEDACQIGNVDHPQHFAALRNNILSMLRRTRHTNTADAIHKCTGKTQRVRAIRGNAKK